MLGSAPTDQSQRTVNKHVRAKPERVLRHASASTAASNQTATSQVQSEPVPCCTHAVAAPTAPPPPLSAHPVRQHHVPSVPLTRRGLLPCSCTSPRPTAGRGICHLQQRPRGCRHTFKGDPGTTKMLATIYRYLSLYVHRACRQDCTLLCVLRIAPDTSRRRRRHTH